MSLEQLVLLAGFTGVGLASFPPRRLGRAMMVTLRWGLRAGLIAVAAAGVMLTVNPQLLPAAPAWHLPIQDWLRAIDGHPPLGRLLLGVASLLASVSVPLIAILDSLLQVSTGPVPTPLVSRLAATLGHAPRDAAAPRPIPESVAAAALPAPQPRAASVLPQLPTPRRVTVGDRLFGATGKPSATARPG